MTKIIIKGAGVQKAVIILSALQVYKGVCNLKGDFSRADVVQEVINQIEFNHSL